MYSRCTLHTQLSASDALQRLSSVVGPERSLWRRVEAGFTWHIADELPPFVGIINGDRFQVRRVIGYRNNFLPIVVGRISPEPDGSRIDVIVGVRAAVGVVMVLWLAATLLGAGAAAWDWWQTANPRALLALFLPLFVGVLILVAFIPEKRKAVTLLTTTLDATPGKPRPSAGGSVA